MKKHLIIPLFSVLFFLSSSAIANSNLLKSVSDIEKSSQKQTTVKYEFSLFQIAYSLINKTTDITADKPLDRKHIRNEELF